MHDIFFNSRSLRDDTYQTNNNTIYRTYTFNNVINSVYMDNIPRTILVIQLHTYSIN